MAFVFLFIRSFPMKKYLLLFTFILLAALSQIFVLAQDNTEQDSGIETEFLFDIRLDGTAPYQFSGGPYGDRSFFPITGGTVEGPEINGQILDGGSDWSLGRADGVFELDVRLTIRTDDDQIIYMSYVGIVYFPPEGESYWRILPRFETGSEEYA
jgi:Protein of unknown function (DUF3237)